ncbi:hypothetical protein QTL86_06510 [Cellulosilyticum sp. ST5]|uniref:hypothetical protein n=1 Tax=Cellulosilyticum sp. ST5 TaxID=3055805 RepID=UPI003977B0F2
MDSKLIQEVQLENQMNMLLEQIEYQLEHPMECSHRNKAMCRQCLYNVETSSPICSKTE